jgi:DNA helicase II / ATP-dependent DNA helicase PcrA
MMRGRSEESREALAMLRLVANNRDMPAMRVRLGLGDASGRSDAYRRLSVFADEHDMDTWTVLERLASGERLEVSARALADRYATTMARLAELGQLAPVELVDAVFPEDADGLAELRTIAVDALADADSAADVLRAVVEAVTQDDVPQNPDFVRIMSLHKSKGLTCDGVYVVGAVDGVLPTIRAQTSSAHDAAMREGRRLFYVAVTRAADELIISSSKSTDLANAAARGVKYDRNTIRMVTGRHVVGCIASPYLFELGPSAPAPETGEGWLAGRVD